MNRSLSVLGIAACLLGATLLVASFLFIVFNVAPIGSVGWTTIGGYAGLGLVVVGGINLIVANAVGPSTPKPASSDSDS